MSTELQNQTALVEGVPTIEVKATKETIAAELDLILKEVSKMVKLTESLRERLHSRILIPSLIHAWKYKDSTVISKVLNGLMTVKDSVRVESLAFWYQHVAGMKVDLDGQTFSCRFPKNKASSEITGKPFTFDAEHLSICKDEKYRYWRVAPVAVKLLSIETNIDKFFDSIEKNTAKALLTGTFTQEQITQYLTDKFMKNAKAYTANEKVKEWVEDYSAQQASKREAA